MKSEVKKAQYYFPNMEDLFIGYECEATSCGDKNGYWHISDDVWKDELSARNICDFYEGNLYLRTPFLSKEEIEKEGWIPSKTKGEFGLTIDCWIKNWDGPGFNEPHKLTLIYYGQSNSAMSIRHEWESSWNRFNEYIYYGKCKSINEFRKICKLLGI